MEITKRKDRDEGISESQQPSRREFLKIGAGAAGGLAASSRAYASITSGNPAGTALRPNFVILLGEGVRADEFSSGTTEGWNAPGLSVMCNKAIATPHLDQIAREGITFHNMFVVNALCLPSRATILTGLYSHSTGCIDNKAREIPSDIPTFADLLRDAGYEVAFFGKAHIRNTHLKNWDYYFGVEAAGADYYHPVFTESEYGIAHPPKRFNGYVDDIVTDRALDWLNKGRSKPFCLFLWFIAPHAPYYRARRYLDLFNGVTVPKPNTFDDDLKGYPGKPLAFKQSNNKIGTTSQTFSPEGKRYPEASAERSLEELAKDHYAGVVANDDSVRRVIAALERMGKLDDTAIFFSSDHGFFLGEWRFFDKRFMHEPSIRVPLMIRYPRLIKPGTVANKMVLNLDLAPTVLEIAGLKIPESMQGRSLVPFFKGSEPTVWRKDWLYEYFEYPGWEEVLPHRGVRTDRYKLIHYFLTPQEYELYDLQEDPGELHNLYGDPRYAKLTADLLNRIDQLRKETGDVYTYEMPNAHEYERQKY